MRYSLSVVIHLLDLAMRQFSIEPRDREFVEVSGVLPFAKNIGKNIGKNISGKCTQSWHFVFY